MIINEAYKTYQLCNRWWVHLESAIDMSLPECLIDLQNDVTAEARFKNAPTNFWISTYNVDMFPDLCGRQKLFALVFPTYDLIECAFTRVLLLL